MKQERPIYSSFINWEEVNINQSALATITSHLVQMSIFAN